MGNAGQKVGFQAINFPYVGDVLQNGHTTHRLPGAAVDRRNSSQVRPLVDLDLNLAAARPVR